VRKSAVLEPSAKDAAEAKKSEATLLQTKLPLQAAKLQVPVLPTSAVATDAQVPAAQPEPVAAAAVSSEPGIERAKDDDANGAGSDSPKVEARELPEPAPDSSEYEPVSVRADAIEFDPQSVRVEVKPVADEARAEALEKEATNAEGTAEIKAAAETPSGTLPHDIVPERPRTPELLIPLESSTDANLHGPASTPGFYPAQRSLSATTSEAPVEIVSRDEEAAPAAEQQKVVRRAKTALWAVSAVCGVLALSLGLTVRALRARPLNVAVQNNVPAPAAAPEPESPKPLSCSLVAPAGKLATSVERSVEPSVVPLDETRVAVGFAAAPSEAQGIVVDVATLDVTRVFDENADARVAQVNPLNEQPPRFLVERESLDFASPRVLTNEPLTALGVARDSVQLRVAGETKALWSLPAGHDAEPQIARLSDGSYRVAFRRGGSTGELVVGNLGSNGSAQGELVPVETGVRLLGSPAIAANKQGAAVVFAGRNQKADPFGLRVAALRPSDVGARAVPLPIEAKEGNGAIAPALSALGDDKWLLQWTQGEIGRYRVLVQPLDADFAPIGSPVAVSPMGANAGQGVLRVFGDKALSLFVLPVPGRDELWGAVLECR
jgi:hypothetical protein